MPQDGRSGYGLRWAHWPQAERRLRTNGVARQMTFGDIQGATIAPTLTVGSGVKAAMLNCPQSTQEW